MLPLRYLFKTYHKLQGSQTIITLHLSSFWFKTYHKLQGSQTWQDLLEHATAFKTYHKLQGSQTIIVETNCNLSLRHIINYKVLKLYFHIGTHMLCLRHIINYKVLKPQIGHHRTHTTCDSCNLCTLLFYNQTPVAVNNMTPTFYICQFQLPLLKKYKVYLFILSRLA